MAAKRVVFLSYLLALLMINLKACSAYRPAPKGPSDTTPGGGGRWSANIGDMGMTEDEGNDMDHNGAGASVNGVGIGFGGGGGVGIGGSGGIGVGAGAGVGIGLGGGGDSQESPEPKPPAVPDQPKPPVVPDQPDPPPVVPDQPRPPADPESKPTSPGGPGIGMGGGLGGGIGNHWLPPPNAPTAGGSTECQPNKPIPGHLTGSRCQPLNCANGDCGKSTMYLDSTSTSDEDKTNKNGIHYTATAMTADPDHVHYQMVMINMEGNKNGGQKAAEPDPGRSLKMSNMGSWTGLAMERIHD